MQADAHVEGAVVGLWRYPVKSMMGEELNATEVTEVRRLRPNFVVSTAPDAQGFVENDWIERTIDLPRDPGILRTAAQYNQANVGVYAEVVAGGTIRRGDPVTLA
jgi:hypothetical protein